MLAAPMASRARRPSMTSLARLLRRGRELPALALVGVWLFGVVLAPLLHLGWHDALAPHTHALFTHAAQEGHDDAHGHAHGGEGHVHADAGDDAAAHANDDVAPDTDAPIDHGRGSLLHGDVAALFPAHALIEPPFVPVGLRATYDLACDGLPLARSLPATHARGPPAHG